MKRLLQIIPIIGIVLVGLAIVSVVLLKSKGFSIETIREVDRREAELNEKIVLMLPGDASSEKKVRVSDLYPYEWDYVCFVADMMSGVRSIYKQDAELVDKKLSWDKTLLDDQRGLVFYDKKTHSLMTFYINHKITGRFVSFEEGTRVNGRAVTPCINREKAYVSNHKIGGVGPLDALYLHFFTHP